MSKLFLSQCEQATICDRPRQLQSALVEYLVQRADDATATVRERLVIYHRDTEPLVPHYEKAGILIRVNGEGDIGAVGDAIRRSLAARGLL